MASREGKEFQYKESTGEMALWLAASMGLAALLGADKDEHGCKGSAGYSWCEAKQKCIRPWEDDCPDATAELLKAGEVCYEFCEDGTCVFINRKDDCVAGTVCSKVDTDAFQSKWVCKADSETSSFNIEKIGWTAITVVLATIILIFMQKTYGGLSSGKSGDVLEKLKAKQMKKGEQSQSAAIEREKFFEEARRQRARKQEEELKKQADAEKKKAERKKEREKKEKEQQQRAKELQKKQEEKKLRQEQHSALMEQEEKDAEQKQKDVEQKQDQAQNDQKQHQQQDVGLEDTAVTVNFQLPDSSKFSLQLGLLTTTVKALKARLEGMTAMPSENHVLIFMGQMMREEARTLASFQISEGSCVHLMVRGKTVTADSLQK